MSEMLHHLSSAVSSVVASCHLRCYALLRVFPLCCRRQQSIQPAGGPPCVQKAMSIYMPPASVLAPFRQYTAQTFLNGDYSVMIIIL